MKKGISLVSALFIFISIFGQSQRLVLGEEFEQASSPGSALQNPTYEALLSTNPTKITSIKYQLAWPGADPMNMQNPTDVASRVAYYGVSIAPVSLMDGYNLTDNQGTGYYSGAPHNFTQARIDSAFAVPAAYTIAVSHAFNSALDSIFITETLNCTQTISGTLINQIALVEKTITFSTAPGSNGETVFHNVMRKMYPSAAGTPVTANTTGTNQTFSFAVPIPVWVYDLNQVAIVAFVQDSLTKDVKQAGMDTAIVLPVSTLDAGISNTTGINAVQCATSVTPSVVVKNFSSTILTSCTINYQLDGGTIMTQPWTGSLTQNAIAIAALPSIPVSVGSHTLVSWTSNPNGGADYHLINDQNIKTFSIVGTSATLPLSEAFASFPPTNWVINNPDNSFTWSFVSGIGGYSTSASESCTYMPFYDDAAGAIDELYIVPIDLTTSNLHATMTFDVAYAQNHAAVDELDVYVSTNCGLSWISAYNKSGAMLATRIADDSSFAPTATQWRTDGVDLTPFLNITDLLIKFRAISGSGNNLFLDNVNIFTGNSALAVGNLTENANSLSVYPNPFNETATINFNLISPSNSAISITNMLGEIVYTKDLGRMVEGNHSVNLDAQKLAAGIYFISLNVADGNKIIQKIVVAK